MSGLRIGIDPKQAFSDAFSAFVYSQHSEWRKASRDYEKYMGRGASPVTLSKGLFTVTHLDEFGGVTVLSTSGASGVMSISLAVEMMD